MKALNILGAAAAAALMAGSAFASPALDQLKGAVGTGAAAAKAPEVPPVQEIQAGSPSPGSREGVLSLFERLAKLESAVRPDPSFREFTNEADNYAWPPSVSTTERSDASWSVKYEFKKPAVGVLRKTVPVGEAIDRLLARKKVFVTRWSIESAKQTETLNGAVSSVRTVAVRQDSETTVLDSYEALKVYVEQEEAKK